MGIFREDLLNFGNLIDREIEIRLYPEDLRRAFPSLEFQFSEGFLKIRGKRRGLLRRSYEFRGEVEDVYSVRDHETVDLGVYLRITVRDGLEEILREEGIAEEGGRLRLSLLRALRGTEVYRRIPDGFRERLVPVRCRTGNGYLALFLKTAR